MNQILKSKLNLILAIGSVGVLMLSFQNCSKYQYAASDLNGQNTSTGIPVNTETLPDGDFVIDGGGAAAVDPSLPAGDGTMGPVVSPNQPMVPSVPQTETLPPEVKPPVANQPQTEAIPPEVKPPVVNLPQPGTIPPDVKPPIVDLNQPGTKPPENKPPVSLIKEEEDDDLVVRKHKEGDECENRIADHRDFCDKYSQGHVSENESGFTVIVPGNIQELSENFKGRLILCGVTLDKVTKREGRLDLVDSTVKEIENNNGNIHVCEFGKSQSHIKSGAELKKCRDKKDRHHKKSGEGEGEGEDEDEDGGEGENHEHGHGEGRENEHHSEQTENGRRSGKQ